MPGITGIMGLGQAEENEGRLRQMTRVMMHEPFYISGRLTHERLGSRLGWVAVRGSFADGMPLWNENHDICLIFSGEDYADPDQIANLKARGHVFNPGNASYLVHSYEEWGDEFFRKLNGRFSGAVIDERHQKTILFNDRYGLNRIYYHEKDGTHYFASEAKSLLTLFPELRELDSRGLAETFSLGCVLDNRTLYRRISLVPGGSFWTFRPGQVVRKEAYFRPEAMERLEPLDQAEYYEKLRETWVRILPRYLRGPERAAVSLTGGKDSRMILAWASAPPGALLCYTFGESSRDCFDVKIARRAAQICRQPHQVIRLNETFFKEFAHLAERTVYLTDGTMDVSGSPGLFVNTLARQVAPVRLTGNYAQEILRSSIAFKPLPICVAMLDPDFLKLVDGAARSYHDHLRGNRTAFVAFKQVPWHHYARLASELSQVTLRSPYLDNEILSLGFQAPKNLTQMDDLQLRLIADGNAELGKLETDRALLYKPIPVFTSLKHRFRELTVKAEYAYDYGMPRSLARMDRLMKGLHVERLFLGRHKYYHFRLWYRDQLSDAVRGILLDSRTLNRPFLKAAVLEQMIKAHLQGVANYTVEIHRLLTAELMQRQFIDSSP